MNEIDQYMALQSYLNSLLLSGIKYEADENFIYIQDFKIKINRNSLTQIKSYQLPVLHCNYPTSFLFFVEKTTELAGKDLNFSDQKNFIEKIIKSNIEQKKVGTSIEENISKAFIQNEQNHYSGHYSHPYPKYKGTEKANDELYFAPELKKEFSLSWCLIKKEKVYFEHSSTDHYDYFKSLEDLYFQSEDKFLFDQNNFYLLPIHPFQLEKIIPQLLENDYKIISKNQRVKWQSTSSTRTIFQHNSKWMLKYSLSIKITNSIRHLQKAEIKRGILLKDVLEHCYGEQLKNDNDLKTLTVLQEPFYFAIKNQKEEIITESICILRENNFTDFGEHSFSQLASLNQEISINGDKRINRLINKIANSQNESPQKMAQKWYEHFLENIIRPISILQARYGIYLGAHQQNIILKLDENDYPIHCYYRDCQGTGFNQKIEEKINNKFSYLLKDQENVLDVNFLDHLMSYYLFINSTYYTIFSIAGGDLELEELLIKITTQKLNSWLRDSNNQYKSLFENLVNQKYIYIKDNYTCCLYKINENTMSNPLDIYKYFKNPFYIGKKMNLSRINSDLFDIQLSTNEIRVTKNNHTIKYQFILNPNEITFQLENENDFNIAAQEALFNNFKEINIINKMSRANFYSQNEIWATSSHDKEIQMVKTNHVVHPKRPMANEGEILYRRYNHELDADISIRVIDRKLDLNHFHDWHNQERVALFWELAKSKEELLQYISNSLSDEHQTPVIVLINNEPVGYFEIYWTPEDRLGPIYENHPFDRGFHLLIGNEKFLGFKNTDALLKAVTHYIFLDCKETQKIMGEPRSDNQKLLRYVDTFPAWRRVKIFDFPHKRAWLLECDREKFFNGNYL